MIEEIIKSELVTYISMYEELADDTEREARKVEMIV